MSEALSIRVVSFNAWALPVTIPTQEKRRRLKRLPAALAALDADVLVLQEVFDVRGRRQLLRELCPPYQTTPDALETRRILGLLPADATGGTVVLSRFSVTGSRFVPHSLGRETKIDERLGRKGASIVHLDTPVGPLTVFALHLYAGTKPEDTRIRTAQLAPLLEVLNAEAATNPVLLAGDINTSPTVGYPEPPGAGNPYTPEYAALIAAGFGDALPPNPTPPELTATWVPSRNRYAALPYQETKSDERYDYVMMREGSSHSWSVRAAGTVLDGAGEHLSDHVGVLVEVDLVPSGA